MQSTGACDSQAIRPCFGALQTVAGTGRTGRRGLNSWRPEFEGRAAIEVELSRPHFAMSDDSGRIYIADKEAHAIRRVDLDGTIHTVAGTGVEGDDGDEPGAARTKRLSRPNGLWVAGDGTLFVLDLGNGKIRRVATDGQMTTLFAVPGGISIGRGLWVSKDESRAFIASGDRILQWERGAVSPFAVGFRSLGNVVVDPEGRLVATDRSAGRVFRLDDRGAKQLIAGNGRADGGDVGKAATDAPLPGVRAVWFDDRGGMFLGTHESSRVWYVGTDGVLQPFFGSNEVSEVRGLSLDAGGNLVFVDNDAGFVRFVPRAR